MVNLNVNIDGLKLKNPIMPASGTFSDDLHKVFDLNLLGAHVAKTITPEIRYGNPTPRISEVENGILNSIGIPSNGIDYFINEILPVYKKYNCPFIASISALTIDEFCKICEKISIEGIDAIEVNISCPNLEDNGKAFAMSSKSTFNVIKKLRSVTNFPLWTKLTPNTGEIIEVAQSAEEAGSNALVVTNTILAMKIDITTKKPTLGNVMGGLSGPVIKPVALRMVYQCSKIVKIPIIGCGGISSAADVIEFFLAGASAAQIGTATFRNPKIMLSIIDDLESYCKNNNIKNISDLIGMVDDKNMLNSEF